jgi:membrane-associated HD superfamily phosphohydrolase
MIENKKRQQNSWAIQMAVIIFMSLVLFYGDLQSSNESIIERTNKFPLYLLLLILPLIGFVYTIIRKNTFTGIRKWMLDNFMKYLSMFVSLVVTTYVVYYVFIIGNPKTWFEWLTACVILASVFVIFLWLKHVEEISDIKLNGKKFVTTMKFIGLFLILSFFSMLGAFALYKYILATSEGIIFLGVFQGILLISGIPAGMEKELKGKSRILVGLIGNAIMLYLILWFEPFRVVLKVTESASIHTYVFYLIIGTLVILIGFLFGYFAKDDNIIIKMFKGLSTKRP